MAKEIGKTVSLKKSSRTYWIVAKKRVRLLTKRSLIPCSLMSFRWMLLIIFMISWPRMALKLLMIPFP